MLKTLTTTAGLVLLVSSFALAGQTPKPAEQPTVTPQSQQQKTQPNGATKKHHKHHKHHKKEHAPAAPKQ
jgi:hypothetical protein